MPWTQVFLLATGLLWQSSGGRRQRAGPLGAGSSRLREQPLPQVVHVAGVGVKTKAEGTPLGARLPDVLCIFP